MTFIIVIALVVLLVLWVISIQNKLVKSDEICNNALKQINVQQISRYDALQALVKLTRFFLASSTPLAMAAVTSLALPRP